MQQLIDRIKKDGKVRPGEVLKVDSFLNHRIDPELLSEMGKEIARLFSGCGVNKILTVEASGIAIAVFAGFYMHCDVVYAKKSKTKNIADTVYCAPVHSYTHGDDNIIVVSKEHISSDDRILIVDDFLAMGAALRGLKSVTEQAGAELVGAAIAIEKAFQPGGKELRAEGMRIESLARIASMSEDSLEFCD